MRLIYGINDSLPGLIVDKYKKYILIQINTAGLDRFRDLIKKTIKEKNQNHEVLFYDNEEYRKAEALPIHERDLLRDDLEVIENGLQYKIPKLAMQKVGYYYDHRENRKKLRSLIERLEIKKDINHAIEALEDTVWFCIHATDETNIEKIDKVLINKGE